MISSPGKFILWHTSLLIFKLQTIADEIRKCIWEAWTDPLTASAPDPELHSYCPTSQVSCRIFLSLNEKYFCRMIVVDNYNIFELKYRESVQNHLMPSSETVRGQVWSDDVCIIRWIRWIYSSARPGCVYDIPHWSQRWIVGKIINTHTTNVIIKEKHFPSPKAYNNKILLLQKETVSVPDPLQEFQLLVMLTQD